MTNKLRCFGTGDELYERYHDEEWGRPLPSSADESELFERLVLEGFQSGLSWITILRKRPAFRAAFADFNPEVVAEFDEEDVERLMQDAGIVRNRRKIEAAITNARALVTLHDDGRTLGEIIQAHRPDDHERPRTVDEPNLGAGIAGGLATELKGLGFTFVGPTTMYALMQAIGVVDDHAADCWLVTSRASGRNAPR